MIYEEYFIKPYLYCISKEDILRIIIEENLNTNIISDIDSKDVFSLYSAYICYIRKTYALSDENGIFNTVDMSDSIINNFQRELFKVISENITINEKSKEIAIRYLIKHGDICDESPYEKEDIDCIDIVTASPMLEVSMVGYYGYDTDEYDEYLVPLWCLLIDNWEEVYNKQVEEKNIQDQIQKVKDEIFRLEKNMNYIAETDITLLNKCSLKSKSNILKSIYKTNPTLILDIIFGE